MWLFADECETASAVNGQANGVGLLVVSPALQGRDVTTNDRDLRRVTDARVLLLEDFL